MKTASLLLAMAAVPCVAQQTACTVDHDLGAGKSALIWSDAKGWQPAEGVTCALVHPETNTVAQHQCGPGLAWSNYLYDDGHITGEVSDHWGCHIHWQKDVTVYVMKPFQDPPVIHPDADSFQSGKEEGPKPATCVGDCSEDPTGPRAELMSDEEYAKLLAARKVLEDTEKAIAANHGASVQGMPLKPYSKPCSITEEERKANSYIVCLSRAQVVHNYTRYEFRGRFLLFNLEAK